jgi:hypothetical protein
LSLSSHVDIASPMRCLTVLFDFKVWDSLGRQFFTAGFDKYPLFLVPIFFGFGSNSFLIETCRTFRPSEEPGKNQTERKHIRGNWQYERVRIKKPFYY